MTTDPKTAMLAMKREADSAYCSALDLAEKNCKGAQYKLENGKFYNDDLVWHCQHHEKIGYHRGMCRVLREIESTLSNHVVMTKEDFEKFVKAMRFYENSDNYRDRYEFGDSNVCMDRGKQATEALAIAQKYAKDWVRPKRPRNRSKSVLPRHCRA